MANQTSNFRFTKPDVNEFYDVNVQNENWDKLDEELKKANLTPVLLTSADDLNLITQSGHYYWRTNNKPANTPTDTEANKLTAMRVWTEDGITCFQEIGNMYAGTTHNCIIRRTVDGGEGYPWEWVNPPMTIGVEYRTVERYDNEPVFVTLQENGVVKKRTDYHGIIAPKTEQWTFTLEDGSTITKAVYVG